MHNSKKGRSITKQCIECPWKVRNRNNDVFVSHSKKHDKPHNCHMLTNDVWNCKPSIECAGYKKYKDGRIN